MNNPQNQNPIRNSGAWIAGVVLIVVGAIFLLQNLNILSGFPFNNWWALFILIPAVASFYRAWQDVQANGHLGQAGRSSLIGGLVLIFIASVFLLDLNWSVIWPVFIIIAGLSALLGGVLR